MKQLSLGLLAYRHLRLTLGRITGAIAESEGLTAEQRESLLRGVPVGASPGSKAGGEVDGILGGMG